MPITPGRLAALVPASATWIVNENDPAPVGPPETEPLGPSVNPGGSAPELTVHA